MANFLYHKGCPKCGSANNVAVYDDGFEKCYTPGCDYLVTSGNSSHGNNNSHVSGGSHSSFTLRKGKHPQFLERERGLLPEYIKKFGVSLVKSPRGEIQVQFPFYLNNIPVAAKYRNCTDTKGNNVWKEKHFAFVGDTQSCKLFGMQTYDSKRKKLVCVEGELDAIAAYQHGWWEYNVISVGMGAKGAQSNLKQHIDWISQHEEIVLLFDEDSAGQEAAQECIQLFPPGKAKIAHLPGGYKDPSSLTMDNRGHDILEAVRNAQGITPRGVLTKEEVKRNTLRYLLNHDQRRGVSTGYGELDNLIGGFMPGELITLVGGTGTGKTSYTLNLTYNATVQAGLNTLFVPLEMTHQTVVSRLTEICLGQKLITQDGIECPVDSGQLETAVDKVLANLDVYNHVGALTPKKLVEIVEFYVRANKTRVVVIDHLHAAVNSLGEDNSVKGIDWFVAELKRVALQFGLTIILVSHQSRNVQQDPEDCKASLSRVRGSAGIAQNSDAVLGLERARDTNVFTVVTLKAHRLFGVYGYVKFEYNPETLRILEESDDYDYSPAEEQGQEETNKTEVSESVRETNNDKPSAPALRTDTTGVSKQLCTGLPSSNPNRQEDLHRSKGVPPRSRPNKVNKSETLASQPGLENLISACKNQAESEVKEFFDIRRVGFEEQLYLFGRRQDTQRMVE